MQPMANSQMASSARGLLIFVLVHGIPSLTNGVSVGRSQAGSGDAGHAATTPPPLTDEDLDRIHSVPCLKVKLRHGAQVGCDGPQKLEEEKAEPADVPPLSIGSYPNWRDAQCNSENEFLCDPEALMNATDRVLVAKELMYTRERPLIKCGQMDSDMAGSDKTYYKGFNLGVAIARDWPSSEADPMSLQKFGFVLMNRWGLMPWYNGVDARNGVTRTSSWQQYRANCPDSALLIILPKYRQVYLSSPSCEFICKERGGPEVITAALAAMDAHESEGEGKMIAAMAQAAIRAANDVLGQTKAQSSYRQLTDRMLWHNSKERQKKLWSSQTTWTVMQRIVVVMMVIAFFGGVSAFAAAHILAPAREKVLRGT